MNLPSISPVILSKHDKYGLHFVYIRITYDGVPKYKSTGIKVNPANFKSDVPADKRNNFTWPISVGETNHIEKNSLIKSKIAGYELDLLNLAKDKQLSKSSIAKTVNPDKDTNTLAGIHRLVKDAYTGILSAGTLKGYQTQINVFLKFKPKAALYDINHATLRAYEKYLIVEQEYMPNGVWNSFKVLLAIFEKAIKMKLIKTNPMSGYEMPRYSNPTRNYLQPAQVTKIEQYADNKANGNAGVTAAWFTLSIHSGLRRSDIKGWNESKMVHGTNLYFSDVKEKTPHFIPIHPALKKAIARVRSLPPLATEPTTILHFKEIEKACKIPIHLTMHVGRHTFAVNYLNRGGSKENLQALMGHKSMKTTEIYGVITSKRIIDEAKRVWGK